MNIKVKRTAVVAVTTLVLSSVGLGIAGAQGPNGSGSGAPMVRDGMSSMGGALVCSTTNYTDVAAKALGMQDADLRQALVGGKSLEQIATSKQVTFQTVEDALNAAYKADAAQAVKDGLIPEQTPQQPGDQRQGNTAPNTASPANPRQTGIAAMIHVPEFNTVETYVVAAKAVGISCVDLAKGLQTGQSIAQVAISKNVPVQTVIDALVSADKAAITQDVQEGLVAQVAANNQLAQAINRAGTLVYSDRPFFNGRDRMGGPGHGPQPGGMPGNGFNGPNGPNGPNDLNGLNGPNGPNDPQPNAGNGSAPQPQATANPQ